jgi:3-phosphoshikimate 1-carboxyvinyltransferase
VAALIVPGSEVVIEGVMMNPLRTGRRGALRRHVDALEAARPHPQVGDGLAALLALAQGWWCRPIPPRPRSRWWRR